MKIDASGLSFEDLNDQIRKAADTEIHIENCMGQRFIASGQKGRKITIQGIPGNALGAYLDGCEITVRGNAQDALCDTMNDGTVVVHGHCGDACGYAMRGGKILIQGSAGYRAGIHMKEYEDKKPILVIGQKAGSFLGEYQAGGLILVLGLGMEGQELVGNFCGTGMHGGKIFLRTAKKPVNLPTQVTVREATREDMQEILPVLAEFCRHFSVDEKIREDQYYVLSPDTNNPYRQMYTHV